MPQRFLAARGALLALAPSLGRAEGGTIVTVCHSYFQPAPYAFRTQIPRSGMNRLWTYSLHRKP